MQDVYFLEWRIDPGWSPSSRRSATSNAEATSGLYAPMAGRIARFNSELLIDPSTINVDGYGKGWLFELTGPLNGTLTVEQYQEFPMRPGRKRSASSRAAELHGRR